MKKVCLTTKSFAIWQSVSPLNFAKGLTKKLFFALAIAFISLTMGAKRTTVLISLDGCRWDYPEMYNTPFLDALGARGVVATMRPSFPSKTFPNHYTIATGLTPDSHGIISNTFYDKTSGLTFSLGNPQTKQDPRFWKGEPIWITAQKQGLRTATVYWPGSDVAIDGRHPDTWQNYEKKPLLSFPARVTEVERLLRLPEAERPHLIMAYFEEPDHNGHHYGPEAKETRAVVEQADMLLQLLYNEIKTLAYADSINLIVTSDHGMARTSPERFVDLSQLVPKEWVERTLYDIPVQIFPKKGYEKKVLDALKNVPHIQTWHKADIPAYLEFGKNPNIGDIVVLPELGWFAGLKPYHLRGAHGYDPTCSDMQVLFRAAGPDFKQGYVRKGTFQNTDIYGLLCRVLHLKPAVTDGRGEAFDILR